jgi:hypothetical protein
MDHLTGGVVDDACPAKFMDARKGDTPSAIGLTNLDGEGSFTTADLSSHTFETLHSYLESGAGLTGRSFIYGRLEGAVAGWQAICVVDDLRLRSTDFTQAKAKNSVRIAAPALANLRGLDPSKQTVVLLIDGTFVQGIPIEGLRKLRDPVITVGP